jgi:DNA repair protein RecO (recombination protein O)
VEATGFVLSSVPFRERDLILRVAVCDLGIISVLARGARGSKKRFGGALDILTPVNMRYKPARRGMGTLVDATRRPGPEPSLSDLPAFAVRSHVAELLFTVIEEGHLTRFPYKLMDWVHTAHAEEIDSELRKVKAAWILDRARVILLHREGRLPNLVGCSRCEEALSEVTRIMLTRDQGLLCDACSMGETVLASCDATELTRLQGLYTGAPFDGQWAPLPIRTWLRDLVHEVAGRNLKSEAVLQQFLA